MGVSLTCLHPSRPIASLALGGRLEEQPGRCLTVCLQASKCLFVSTSKIFEKNNNKSPFKSSPPEGQEEEEEAALLSFCVDGWMHNRWMSPSSDLHLLTHSLSPPCHSLPYKSLSSGTRLLNHHHHQSFNGRSGRLNHDYYLYDYGSILHSLVVKATFTRSFGNSTVRQEPTRCSFNTI